MKELHIRLEDIIHEQLQREADEDERSLNKYVIRKLSLPYTETKHHSTASGDFGDTKWPEPDQSIALLLLEKDCCTSMKPCVHWVFNGEVWRNSLSGREREPEL
jgi:hypothetical protein